MTIVAGRSASSPSAVAGAIAHGLRTGDAALRQMLHQPDEERQILGFHALFIKGEDILALGRVHEEIGILDPLRDPLERNHLADFIKREEVAQRFVRDLGVDRHVLSVELAQ